MGGCKPAWDLWVRVAGASQGGKQSWERCCSVITSQLQLGPGCQRVGVVVGLVPGGRRLGVVEEGRRCCEQGVTLSVLSGGRRMLVRCW